MNERLSLGAHVGARMVRRGEASERLLLQGVFAAQLWRPLPHLVEEYCALRDTIAAIRRSVVRWALEGWRLERLERRRQAIEQELVWSDVFPNTAMTEGKNAGLTHLLKGSTYTASQALGLIEDTGYSAIAATNTAANITAAGGGSPANGWNEAQSSTCASRGTPTFGTASGGSLATSSAVAMSMLATDTIKGAFLLIRSGAGTAPSTTVGNTNGALLSAGLFSGGDRAVINGDTLNVSYTLNA